MFATRPITLGSIPRVAAGRRPVVRVNLRRGGVIRFQVRPASTPRPVGAFTRALPAGPSRFTMPAGLARKLRAGRTYVMTARGVGTVDSVRCAIKGRARR